MFFSIIQGCGLLSLGIRIILDIKFNLSKFEIKKYVNTIGPTE